MHSTIETVYYQGSS